MKFKITSNRKNAAKQIRQPAVKKNWDPHIFLGLNMFRFDKKISKAQKFRFNIWFHIGLNIWFNIGFNIWFHIGLDIGLNIWFNILFNIGFNIGFNIQFNILLNTLGSIFDSILGSMFYCSL